MAFQVGWSLTDLPCLRARGVSIRVSVGKVVFVIIWVFFWELKKGRRKKKKVKDTAKYSENDLNRRIEKS